MCNFNFAIVDRSCIIRLLQSNHHQAVYQKYIKEIILHIGGGRGLCLTKIILCTGTCQLVEKPLKI